MILFLQLYCFILQNFTAGLQAVSFYPFIFATPTLRGGVLPMTQSLCSSHIKAITNGGLWCQKQVSQAGISNYILQSGFPHTLENSGKWPFHGKSGKTQGICQAPQGIIENSKISGKSQGILAMADLSGTYEKSYIVFYMFWPQYPCLHHVWKHILVFIFSIQKTLTFLLRSFVMHIV